MLRFATGLAVLGVLLSAGVRAGDPVDVGAPKLPKEVLAYMEVKSLEALDQAIDQFVQGIGVPAPSSKTSLKLTRRLMGATAAEALRPNGALRAFVFAPLNRSAIVAVVPAADPGKLMAAMEQGGMKRGTGDGGMTTFSRERRQFDHEAYKKAPADQKRNFQQFMRTIPETYYVTELGKSVVVGQNKEHVVQICDLIKKLDIADGSFVTGEGQLAYFARPKAILAAPENPVVAMRKKLTTQLAAMPGQEAAGRIIEAEFQLLEALAKELETSAVSLRLDGKGLRLTTACRSAKGGALETYLASIPKGSPALMKYLRSDLGVGMAMRVGDLAPAIGWYPDFLKKMMGGSGQDAAKVEQMGKAVTDYAKAMGSDMVLSFSLGQTLRLVEAFAVKDTKAFRDLMEKNTELSSGMNFGGMTAETGYERDVANYKGMPVDRMSIQYRIVQQGDQPAPAMAGVMNAWVGAMNALIGSIHIAAAEKLVVVTAGGDSLVDLQKTLDNQFTPLSESELYREVMAVLPEDGFAMAYVSLTSLVEGALEFVKGMMGGNLPGPVQQAHFEPGPGVGMTARTADGTVVVDVWAPALGIRRIVEGFQGAAAGGPAGGNAPR